MPERQPFKLFSTGIESPMGWRTTIHKKTLPIGAVELAETGRSRSPNTRSA